MTGGGVEPGRRSPAGKPLQTGKGSGTRPAFAWLPHPGKIRPAIIRKRSVARGRGETQPKGKAPAPAESAGKSAGGRPGSPVRVPGKKAPPFLMERQSFRSNRPFAAVRPAERAGKQSPLPIKPSFRGNAYIFSRFRKNTGRCGRCAPFSVSVFASAFPRRISG